ncbi:GSCFA domain-containing protein [Octadecabacter sp.]|nr:GSCFA domain-containing protein [Octadecabacter sp.]
MRNPYKDLPNRSFWRKSVTEKGVFGYSELWISKWRVPRNGKFSTYGSCFAQHISRALVARELDWLDCEQPPGNASTDLAKKFNYGVYSSRTANIYTARQLLTWCEFALDVTKCSTIEVWEKDGRYFDSLRPAIEPNGFASVEECRASLMSTAYAFRRSIVSADVFVFTLGLTEGWENKKTGQPYAVCPGTIAGRFSEDDHVFRNYDYVEVLNDIRAALDALRILSPNIRILLTVSPVPLVATASREHVLVATQYSKSVLRAVAGSISMANEDVDYFPSYELIAGAPTRGMFFEPDMRSVAQQGVDLVMGHFFEGLRWSNAKDKTIDHRSTPDADRIYSEQRKQDLICEEIALDKQDET